MPVRPSTRRDPDASHRRARAAERPLSGAADPPSAGRGAAPPPPAPGAVPACHPPDGAEGDFHRTLAHVSLPPDTLDGGRGRAPRLALLVFAEGELPEDPGATGRAAERTVRDLLHPAEEGVAGPAPEAPGAPDSPCRTVDVPAALFAAVAPKSGEAPYLTHTRPTAGQPGEGQTVVTANRFPSGPGRYTAHLVSLDGHPLPPEGPGAVRAVRLHSLVSWSFRHGGPAGGAPGPEPARRSRPALRGASLRLPPPEGAPDGTADRLRRGYVPVPHRLPSGERTHAWYRGPAVPAETPLPAPEEAAAPHTAEEALLRGEDGAFDVSLAAAWRLGQDAARSCPEQTRALARARRRLAARAAGITERSPRPGAPLPSGLAAEEFGRILAEGAPPPAEPFDRLLARAEAATALDRPGGGAALAGAAEHAAAALAPHLERLALLHGVPLRYLVPHPDMLPPESLCPFRTDHAWIDALLAGAACPGLPGGPGAPEDRIDAALRTAAVRAGRAHRPEAGLLIRSHLVETGPEPQVTAYAGGGRGSVRELRRDRLAPDVLLVLFDALPEVVEVGGSGRGSWFGLGRGDAFSLRVLAPGPRFGRPRPDGAAFPDRDDPAAGTVLTRFMREDAPERRVLRLAGAGGLVRALADALGRDALTPDEFALHLAATGHQHSLRPRAVP
ncbi:hypothetical protein J0910_14020 [Nocardiopsis sp. CNT-189]|uniref:hypothetical protein n=1 Tax=Nocardiopsis oceanisediminis TaxID=2816862 RepID=UPI003B3180A5